MTVLGRFAASFKGKPVRFPTRKAQALVAYLALGDQAGESRERMVALLWSESGSKRARDSLRQAIKEVNDGLLEAGFEGFHPGKQVLSLERSLVITDLDEVMASAAEGRVHQRLLDTQRLADTLLDSIEAVDPSFQVWVRAKRHALHERLTMTLENALSADAGAGAEIAQALLNLDPTHEAACRHLMRLRVTRGEIGAALKAYKALWDVLAEDYDIEPSKETQDLVVHIKQQTGWSTRPGDPADPRLAGGVVTVPSPPAAARRPQRLFIAVRPFNVEGIPEQLRSAVNGFRHEFVASLARFREWSVRALAVDARAPAAPEGSPTEYVFDATAYGKPEEMRLIVTLEDGNHEIVWSDQFTLPVSDLLASQQRIVRSMALGLRINLSADRQRRLTSEADLSKELHDAWLRGQDLLHGLNPKDWRTAAGLFRLLTKEAPDFSPAFSSMVQLNNTKHIVFPGVFRNPKEHAATLQLAQRAAQLDPQDSRAQLGVAWAHQLVGRATEASLHADFAVDLNPNDPWTLIAAAQIHAYCGAYAKAVALCIQSIKLTPDPSPTQRSYASAIFFLAGMYRESVDVAIEGLDPSPAFAIWRCASLAQLERVAEARELMQRTVELVKAAWDGSSPASDRMVCRWLLHMFPIAVEDDWERLRRSLVAAGAPAKEERFGQW